jgi:hypothetical protein
MKKRPAMQYAIVSITVGTCLAAFSSTPDSPPQRIQAPQPQPSGSSTGYAPQQSLSPQSTPKSTIQSPSTSIPDLQDGEVKFKDITWFRELVTSPGERFGYFSNKKLKFDEEGSFFRFGSQRSRIAHSGDALKLADPVTITLATYDDPLNYAKNAKTVLPPSGSVVWIEPSKDGSKLILTTDGNRLTSEQLRAVGIDRTELPALKLEFHVEPPGVIFLLGDGAQYWGATEGPIKLGGKVLRNLKGVRIVNGVPSDRGNPNTSFSTSNAAQSSEKPSQTGGALVNAEVTVSGTVEVSEDQQSITVKEDSGSLYHVELSSAGGIIRSLKGGRVEIKGLVSERGGLKWLTIRQVKVL